MVGFRTPRVMTPALDTGILAVVTHTAGDSRGNAPHHVEITGIVAVYDMHR